MVFQTYHLVVAAEMDSFSVESGRAAISFGSLNLTVLFPLAVVRESVGL